LRVDRFNAGDRRVDECERLYLLAAEKFCLFGSIKVREVALHLMSVLAAGIRETQHGPEFTLERGASSRPDSVQ
jgi:hypothetical protein